MPKLLKASEAASLAIHALVQLASANGELVSTKQIANALRVSEAHLAKVLNRLAKQGLVKATRGPKGGLVLARSAEEITLKNIYTAVEGPLDAARCILNVPVCDGHGCVVGQFFTRVANEVQEMMSRTTLAQITHSLGEESHESKTNNRN